MTLRPTLVSEKAIIVVLKCSNLIAKDGLAVLSVKRHFEPNCYTSGKFISRSREWGSP